MLQTCKIKQSIGVEDETATMESKLDNYISANQFKGFEYGKHDCCSFTIEAQKILTGSTLFPEFDGTYEDLEGGKAILHKLGYKTWIGACNDRLEKIPVALAKRKCSFNENKR